MRRIFLLMSLCVLTASLARAETITMICKNPRREYVVIFDNFAKSLVTKAEEGGTPYRVDKVRRVGRGYFVEGLPLTAAQLFMPS